MTHFLASTVVVCALVWVATMAVHQIAEDAGNRAASSAIAVACGIAAIVGILAGAALAFLVLAN